jgi:hypothetical protein
MPALVGYIPWWGWGVCKWLWRRELPYISSMVMSSVSTVGR